MRNSTILKLVGMVFAAALAASAATAWADDVDDMMCGYGPGYGMGPGMGMMYGGYGMGPGMMGGGYGPMGMMGDGYGGMGMMGMGPGMMGGGYGYGMGHGMGMMGMGPLGMLDLSDEQRTKINKIFDEERQQHWTIMGKMMDKQSKLRDLYTADKPDPKKVGTVYGEIAKLRQQMIETHIQATNQMQDVLTKEQREQLRQWPRGRRGQGWGPRGPAAEQRGTMGPGNTPGGMMGR